MSPEEFEEEFLEALHSINSSCVTVCWLLAVITGVMLGTWGSGLVERLLR